KVLDNAQIVAPNAGVQVWSDEPCVLRISGVTYYVDSDLAAKCTANASGMLNITVPITALSAPVLKISSTFMPASSYVELELYAPVKDYLNGISAQDLTDAQKQDDQGNDTPLITNPDPATMQALANGINKLMSLTKTEGDLFRTDSYLKHHLPPNRVAKG